MILKIISGALIVFTSFMSIKHGWQGINAKPGDTGPQVDLFKKINLGVGVLKVIAGLSLLSGILILAPQTFVAGNVLNAAVILFLLIRFLMVGEIKPALIEVPFLLIPLALIWLKYPLAF